MSVLLGVMSKSTYQKSENQKISLNEEQKVYVKSMIKFMEEKKLVKADALIKKYRAKKKRAFNTFINSNGRKMVKNMELDTEYMYVVEGLMQLKYETQDIIRKYSSELTFGAEQHIIDLYNEIIADKKSKGEWEKALEEVSGVVA